MFWVTRPEILTDLKVGGGPKAAEIIGDLDGAEVRTEQVKQNGHPPERDARRVGPAEQFLKSDSQDRWTSSLIDKTNAASARNQQELGSLIIEKAVLSMSQSRFQRRDERGAS